MFRFNPFRGMMNALAGTSPGRRTRPKRRQSQLRLIVEQLETRTCPSPFTVIATGLNNPRGLTFGPIPRPAATSSAGAPASPLLKCTSPNGGFRTMPRRGAGVL
jgi:hypothetical protein